MKLIGSILLILIIFISSFKEVAIFVSFKINQDYLAKNLCVEREIEESTCAGCCQLTKKLEEQHTDKNTALPSRKTVENIALFFSKDNTVGLFIMESMYEFSRFINLHNQEEHLLDLLRPPQLG